MSLKWADAFLRNQVAYEYIACQQENHGVLILSEFAGAGACCRFTPTKAETHQGRLTLRVWPQRIPSTGRSSSTRGTLPRPVKRSIVL